MYACMLLMYAHARAHTHTHKLFLAVLLALEHKCMLYILGWPFVCLGIIDRHLIQIKPCSFRNIVNG